MQADFHALVEQAMAEGHFRQMRPVIEKELLHYDILFALDRHGFLDRLTFQGGTALRLCHGAPRFSEDLDFAGGHDFDADMLAGMADSVRATISGRYGLDIEVKTPKREEDAGSDGIRVNRWQLSVVTAPARPDLPRQKIRIEVVNIPAYTREPLALRRNYAALPDGYGDTLIQTETLREIMADKLVSLVVTERYVRYRDIWDLRWLSQHGASPDGVLLNNKLADYRVEGYAGKLARFRQRLPAIIHDKAFRDSMIRFLPADVIGRTFDREGFLPFLEQETDRLLSLSDDALDGNTRDESFRI